MSRELKFRIWDKKDKFFIDNGALQFGADGKIYYIYAGLEYGEPELEREDITDEVIVEQYTGLKDKNGKEIYEGDIVKYNHNGSRPETVSWWSGEEEYYPCYTVSGFTLPYTVDGYEVIGNIHENPELLEKK